LNQNQPANYSIKIELNIKTENNVEMDKLSKAELIAKCGEFGIKPPKTKTEMIDAIERASTPKTNTIEIKNECGLEYLKSVKPNSIDLILTDPPYIISKDSGMNELYNSVKHNEENDITAPTAPPAPLGAHGSTLRSHPHGTPWACMHNADAASLRYGLAPLTY